MKPAEKHLIEYMALLVAFSIFAFLFAYYRFNAGVLEILAGTASIFYILWGIIHHVIEGRLTRLIALEYFLFGSLAFVLLFTVINY